MKRNVVCTACAKKVAEIETEEMFFQIKDSSDTTHVAPLSMKSKLEEAVFKAGLTFKTKWKLVPKDEPIVQGLCTSCEDKFTADAETVLQGGMFFRCAECGKRGVIHKCQFVDEFRASMGEEYTHPNEEGIYPAVFGEFENCSKHKVNIKKESNDTPQQ